MIISHNEFILRKELRFQSTLKEPFVTLQILNSH